MKGGKFLITFSLQMFHRVLASLSLATSAVA